MARRRADGEAANGPAQDKPRPKKKARPAKGALVLSGVPRVNLLPLSELERRATRGLLKQWAIGGLVTAAVVTGLVVGANAVRAVASLELAAEQARTIDLNGELAGFSEVSRALAERSELTVYRGAALASDVEWRPLVSTVLAAVPKDSEVTGFTLVTGATPAEDADPATAIGLIGTLTLNTEDARDVGRMVENLRALEPGLAAEAGPVTAVEDGGVDYTVQFVLSQAVYSGRFAGQAGVR
jgi:hypothetical protein